MGCSSQGKRRLHPERCIEKQLYELLKLLDPATRRMIVTSQLNQGQRLALERWIMSHKDSLGPADKVASSMGRPPRSTRSAPQTSQGGSVPISGTKGVHTSKKGGVVRYCASVQVGPFSIASRYDTSMQKALKFLEVAVAIRTCLAPLFSGNLEPGAIEAAFRAAMVEEPARHGSAVAAEIDLRFSVTVYAGYWVGVALRTPQFSVSNGGLDDGLRAWRLLSEARGQVFQGVTNRFSIVRHHSPEELDAAWARLRPTYERIWAEAMNRPQKLAAVTSRLDELEAKHREQQQRRADLWRQVQSSAAPRAKKEEQTAARKRMRLELRIKAVLSRWARAEASRQKKRSALKCGPTAALEPALAARYVAPAGG